MITIINTSREIPSLEIGKEYQEVKRVNEFWIKDEMGGWIAVNKLEECEVNFVS